MQRGPKWVFLPSEEAYLEELEDLCCAEEEEVTQSTEGPADGGDDVVMEKKKFSFAKAALLVQGSTYVYSKKVRVQLEKKKTRFHFFHKRLD